MDITQKCRLPEFMETDNARASFKTNIKLSLHNQQIFYQPSGDSLILIENKISTELLPTLSVWLKLKYFYYVQRQDDSGHIRIEFRQIRLH